ncbi:hypothetical protein [Massilia sp. 9I]|uniref:hypothetical protein n=1 Tax=Massilia sp. 9I TaxID=2653152 RepID=UPI0012F3C034|nr:hypothetical protein [Massilia sp. 9I]VXB76152.1 conserved hypothetical protein [Massilia sp. 9I]
MQHTLVAVFDNRTDAQNAMNELTSSGFSRDEVKLSNADPTGMTDSVTGSSATTDTDTLADGTGASIGASIKHFFTDLFGADNSTHASKYEGAVTRGHHVLTVRADSLPEVERAADIVERYGPTDIDEQASGTDTGIGAMGAGGGLSESMRMSGAGGMQQSAQMSAQSGTGSSQGGGTTSTGAAIASTPVGASMGAGAGPGSIQQLDNPGDRKLFQQQSLNQAEPMGTTYQEPQGKSGLTATGGTSLQASTLQENSVQASALEGTQSDRGLHSSGIQGGTLQGSSLEGSALQGGAGGSMQRDTAMGSGSASSSYSESQRGKSRIYSRSADSGSGLSIGSNFFGDDDDYYRNHFLANYSGDDYDSVKPAYAYGSEMARSDKYRGRKWDEVENDLQSDWSARNAGAAAGATWEKMKAAVRRGWDRMTSDDDDTIYRSHFSSTYGSADGTYDEYKPAYSYGSEMAMNDRFRGRKWDDVENDLRSDWSSRSGSTAGDTWEKMKAAVRRGWDRMTLDRDDDSYYRSHYDSNLSSTGIDYDSAKPAYSYGSEMRKSEMYRNRPWDDIEGDLARGWDSRVTGTTGTSGVSSSATGAGAGAAVGGAWDKMKSAVRHGWDRMTDDDDDDREYRSHWNATYSTATGAGSYDEYKPAYSYGSEMARNEKYRGRQWGEVENDLRSDWDSRYGSGDQSSWEKMKSAVRHGWDRMTS